MRAVAAPVRDGFGDVVAALGASGPAAELPDVDAVAAGVSRAADALSAQLGAAAS